MKTLIIVVAILVQPFIGMPPTHQEIGGRIEKSEQVELPSYEPYEQEKLASSISIKSEPTTAPSVAVSGTCEDWMQQAGVTDMVNARILIMRESGCNPNARNVSSGACGIPQALPCSKLGTSDPVAQIKWMQNYVNNRYGSWANAVAHSNSVGWY